MTTLIDRDSAERMFADLGMKVSLKGNLRKFQYAYLAADGEDSDRMGVAEFEAFMRDFASDHNLVKVKK